MTTEGSSSDPISSSKTGPHAIPCRRTHPLIEDKTMKATSYTQRRSRALLSSQVLTPSAPEQSSVRATERAGGLLERSSMAHSSPPSIYPSMVPLHLAPLYVRLTEAADAHTRDGWALRTWLSKASRVSKNLAQQSKTSCVVVSRCSIKRGHRLPLYWQYLTTVGRRIQSAGIRSRDSEGSPPSPALPGG